MIYFSITEADFEQLLTIQQQIYEKNQKNTQKIVDFGIDLLDFRQKKLAIKTNLDLNNILFAKAKKLYERKGFLYGLRGFKSIFWNGYFRALIPFLIKEYYSRGFDVKDFKSGILDINDGKDISNYLFSKYPILSEILLEHKKSYHNFILTMPESLKVKFGYPIDVSSISKESFNGFSKSIFVDLMKQIQKSDKELIQFETKQRVIYLLEKYGYATKTQQEIADNVGTSQSTVNRIRQELPLTELKIKEIELLKLAKDKFFNNKNEQNWTESCINDFDVLKFYSKQPYQKLRRLWSLGYIEPYKNKFDLHSNNQVNLGNQFFIITQKGLDFFGEHKLYI